MRELACRRVSCFDILPPGAAAKGRTTTIAERNVLQNVPLLKAVYLLMAHDWDTLVKPYDDEENSYFSVGGRASTFSTRFACNRAP